MMRTEPSRPAGLATGPRPLATGHRLLAIDALTCLATGVLLLAATGEIARLTAIPEALLRGAGLLLLPIAAFMAFFAARSRIPAWAWWTTVIGNGLWVAASVLLPLTGTIAPNGLGWAFLLAQAGVVAIVGALEVRYANGGR